MRFIMLMIPKGYEKAAPGAMPDPKAVAAMMKYNESLQKATAGHGRHAAGGGPGPDDRIILAARDTKGQDL
jgi:hypothetical protein